MKNNKRAMITYSWFPGREGVRGNEEADEQAKAAGGEEISQAKDIPRALRKVLKSNATAIRREYNVELKRRTKLA